MAVATLTRYFAGPVTRNGLVLGYGCATVPDVTKGCHVLAEILRLQAQARREGAKH